MLCQAAQLSPIVKLCLDSAGRSLQNATVGALDHIVVINAGNKFGATVAADGMRASVAAVGADVRTVTGADPSHLCNRRQRAAVSSW